MQQRYKGGIVIEGFVNAEGRAHCITPLLFETGWVPFDVSTDGVNFDRSGEYLLVHPGLLDPALTAILANVTRWQYYGTPNAVLGELQMTWNSSLIISAERVNIELWGYRENLSNSGVFSFLPKPTQKPLSDWELGSIHVRSASHADGARNVQGLWSEEHTMAWHLEQAFRDDSAGWALAKCCAVGHLREQPAQLPGRAQGLSLYPGSGPCGHGEADYSCDMDKGSVCIYHPGGFHCVRSIQASPTYGSGQQCCYDKTGAQILSGDSTSGSSPDRVPEMGSPPYRVATRSLGVFVSSPCPENVTVMFASGVGLEVRGYQGLMTVTVLLPTAYTNHTHGLLGQMNSDLSDDLQTRLGQVLPSANATPESIFSFGASWDILNETSLFTYDSEYLLDTRTPDSGSGLTPALYVPEDGGRAPGGRHARGLPDPPGPPTSPAASFSCDDGYTLTGSPQRSCLHDGSWSGEQAYCA
ncbi:unnamed protein product [Boreogadus saida]